MTKEKAGWIVSFEINGETYYPSSTGGTTNKILTRIHTSPNQALRWCNLNLNRWYWDTVVLEHVVVSYGKMTDVTLEEIEGSL